MKRDFLPIGTVVLLKGGEKSIMISGYLFSDENNNYYDYLGCLFPEGIISFDKKLVFNESDIEKVIFSGYKDNSYEKLNTVLNDIKSEKQKNVK